MHVREIRAYIYMYTYKERARAEVQRTHQTWISDTRSVSFSLSRAASDHDCMLLFRWPDQLEAIIARIRVKRSIVARARRPRDRELGRGRTKSSGMCKARERRDFRACQGYYTTATTYNRVAFLAQV